MNAQKLMERAVEFSEQCFHVLRNPYEYETIIEFLDRRKSLNSCVCFFFFFSELLLCSFKHVVNFRHERSVD